MDLPTLRINDLSLQPYAYQEKTENGRLLISARVELGPEQFDDFRQLLCLDPVSVIRTGLDTSPRTMIISPSLWSLRGVNRVCHVDLVDAPDPRPPLTSWGMSCVLADRVASRALALSEALTNLLAERGVITGADAARLLEEAKQRRKIELFECSEVPDLDESLDAEDSKA